MSRISNTYIPGHRRRPQTEQYRTTAALELQTPEYQVLSLVAEVSVGSRHRLLFNDPNNTYNQALNIFSFNSKRANLEFVVMYLRANLFGSCITL